MKNVNNKKTGPQAKIHEAAAEVSSMEELRSFWEKFSRTDLLAISEISEDRYIVRRFTDIISASLEAEKVDVGAICRTYSLKWNVPSNAMGGIVQFCQLFNRDDEIIGKLNTIKDFLKKHICQDIVPGHYSRNGDCSTYIDVHKTDIERAIKELTRRKQPTSSRMIKEFLYDTLPFVSAI